MNCGKIGIDLGTTYSCCCVAKNDLVVPVAYNDGAKTVPSIVFHNPDSGEIVVGRSAKSKTKNVVFDSKRFIGRNINDVYLQEDMRNWPFKIVDDNGIPKIELIYNKKNVRLTANDISSEILKHIKFTADAFLGQDVNKTTETVITVPAYFNYSQRQKTKEAAEIANLKVIQIINEPTAAAIAYTHQRIVSEPSNRKNKEKFLIYDFGGGTFDVSIIELDYINKIVRVIATDGDSHLGGEDIDERLADYCISEYKKICEENNKKPENFNRQKIKKSCEELKKNLTSFDETYVDMPDDETSIELTNALLDNLCRDLFQRTFDLMDRVLNYSKMKDEDIDNVVLVGGSSRIKKIETELKKRFNKKICKDINVEEVVARGATIVANEESFRFTVQDVTTHTLSTEIAGNRLLTLVERFTPIPHTTKPAEFSNDSDNQKFIEFSIYEGEGQTPSDRYVQLLKSKPFYLQTPNVAGKYIVECYTEIDKSGLMKLHIKDKQNDREDRLEINLK